MSTAFAECRKWLRASGENAPSAWNSSYHTNKCLNFTQESLEGDWVCPDFFPCTCMFVTCMSFMHFWHTCTLLFLYHHCLLNPLSHYYCHALLNMSPYWYLIHGTKYFRGGLNISYSVLKYSVRGDQIFRPGGQNWGDRVLAYIASLNSPGKQPTALFHRSGKFRY